MKNKKYVVINSAGSVLRAGSCAVSEIPLQARAGESAIEVDDLNWDNISSLYVDSNRLTTRQDLKLNIPDYVISDNSIKIASNIPIGTTIEITALDTGQSNKVNVDSTGDVLVSLAPGSYMVRAIGGYKSQEYILRVVTLEQRKDEIWELVKAKRDSVREGGCTTQYGKVQTNEKSRALLLSAREFAKDLPQSGHIPWTMEDDSVLQATPAILRNIFVAVASFVNETQKVGTQLRTEIANAVTVEQLEAINIDAAAWPT